MRRPRPTRCMLKAGEAMPRPYEPISLRGSYGLRSCHLRMRSCRSASARSGSTMRTVASRSPLPSRAGKGDLLRSEEHTSELQSHSDLVCRLLLEKKKKKKKKKKQRKHNRRKK